MNSDNSKKDSLIYENELREKLMRHYASHRAFMNGRQYETFINTRLHNEDYQKPWINTLIALILDLKEKDILDVGCGDGGFVVAMKKHCYSVKGCDVSHENIEMAKLRARKWGIDEGLLVESGGTSLPYANDSFDVVVMFDVIEHVANIPAIIAETHRVLKPGGYFFSSTPNRLWPKEPHVNLLFIHWMPRVIRRPCLLKLRGIHAVELINSINYLSSRKLYQLLSPHFSQCLLNDQIFMLKLKKQHHGQHSMSRSSVKELIAKPGLWFFMKYILRWLWPSVYVLAKKSGPSNCH